MEESLARRNDSSLPAGAESVLLVPLKANSATSHGTDGNWRSIIIVGIEAFGAHGREVWRRDRGRDALRLSVRRPPFPLKF